MKVFFGILGVFFCKRAVIIVTIVTHLFCLILALILRCKLLVLLHLSILQRMLQSFIKILARFGPIVALYHW